MSKCFFVGFELFGSFIHIFGGIEFIAVTQFQIFFSACMSLAGVYDE